jgi:guanylate kinase
MTREELIKMLPDLVRNYQAPPEVTAQINNVDLLMIIGPTGSGKTAIIKRLGIPYVPTDTTRPKRPDEAEGLDYFFRTDYDQIVSEIKNRQFVQIAIGPAGDFYATRANVFPKIGLAVYAVLADVIPQFRQLGFSETTSAFITPPNFLEWMNRIDRNNVESDQLPKRLEEAKRSFSFALNDPDIHFILNDDLDKAVYQTRMLVSGKPNLEREAAGRQAAEQIFKELTFA